MLVPTGMKIRIKHYLPDRTTGTFDVLGGYHHDDAGTIVLYRSAAKNVVPSDHAALLGIGRQSAW